MSLDITKLSRNRVLAAATETTTGTPATLGAGASGLFSAVKDPKFLATIPNYHRQSQNTLSPPVGVPGTQALKATWQTEFFGSGTASTAPTWATVLMAACGVSFASNVASPFTPNSSTPLTTVTLGSYLAGELLSGQGCAGTFTISGQDGQPALIDWDFDGVWIAPTDTAIPTGISYPTVKPPPFVNASISVGSAPTVRLKQFKFTAGVKIYLREDASASASGFRSAVVIDRTPMISLDPEFLALSSINYFAGQAAATTYAFSATIGSSTGNQMTIAASAAQLDKAPNPGDRGGVVINELEFLCTGTADSEWSITFN